MTVLKFPLLNTYEEHWRHLDRFISGDIKQKKKLGFLMHDLNEDGRICPSDLFDLIKRLKPSDTLLSYDIYHIINKMSKKIKNEQKPAGWLLKQLNEDFLKKMNELSVKPQSKETTLSTNSPRHESSHDSERSKVRFNVETDDQDQV